MEAGGGTGSRLYEKGRPGLHKFRQCSSQLSAQWAGSCRWSHKGGGKWFLTLPPSLTAQAAAGFKLIELGAGSDPATLPHGSLISPGLGPPMQTSSFRRGERLFGLQCTRAYMTNSFNVFVFSISTSTLLPKADSVEDKHPSSAMLATKRTGYIPGGGGGTGRFESFFP